MGKVVYEHVEVEKMLHRLNVWFLPFRWGSNVYRGCEHDCIYCNARYTHEYLGMPTGEFSHKIIVKDNAAEALEREFSKEKWNKNLTVNVSTVSDPYQPAEKEFGNTRKVLKVFLKHHNALLVTTKSDLVLKDIDLLEEISKTGFLNVCMTITTLDQSLSDRIEPRVPSIEKRLEAIKQLKEAGITVGVTAIPVLPYISDDEETLEEMIKTFSGLNVDYVIVDVLNFKGETRQRMVKFLEDYDPSLIPKYEALYQTDYCDKEYSKGIRKITNKLVKKYGVDHYDKMFSYRKNKEAK
ncbi:MAG: radical SAM protein [Candidatus Methanofastidiosa archaeon]|nr:radical SAM protein [Candidatus Methanofastidiosa archaeon]